MKYQLREWVCDGKTVFQVWQCHPVRAFWGTKYRWERLKDFTTYGAAQNYISKLGGGYNRRVHDYDESGKLIVYAW